MPARSLPSLTLAIVLCLPSLAMAQQQPPQPDVPALAADLGISEDQARACLPDAPPSQGERPSESERAAIVNCFKTANPNLTDDDIRNAMRPPRR